MAETPDQAFTILTDNLLASTVAQARRRVVVVAPAVWSAVATAICGQYDALGADGVAVILDSDPEVYRLGYGEFPALEALQAKAREVGAEIRRQPGIRIGLVVADDTTLIFVPTPKLIEAGPNTSGGANAIRLTQAPGAVRHDLGLEGDGAPVVGRAEFDSREVERVKADLNANPPMKFDLARKLTVFNAFIEFVELEVQGTEVGRRTAAIPNHLLAVVRPRTREQLQARFRIVPDDHRLSGKALGRYRRRLLKPFLHVIPGFGTVVLHRDKPKLKEAVATLQAEVKQFAERVRDDVQKQIDAAVSELVTGLQRALVKQPPKDWFTPSGNRPTADEVKALLEAELRAAFGTADDLASTMSVKCVFRGVTYELLNDPKFVTAAREVLPQFDRFHREFPAIEGEKRAKQQAVLDLD